MDIRKMKPEDDAFGKALVALMTEFDITTFVFSGISKLAGGVTSMQFESTQLGMTALALMVQANPDLFLLLEEAKLGAYLTLVKAMFEKNQAEQSKEVKEDDLLKNFTVKGKLKN